MTKEPQKSPWKPIESTTLYGYSLEEPPYRAEVIRAYEKQWVVYFYRDSKMVPSSEVAPHLVEDYRRTSFLTIILARRLAVSLMESVRST